jgi:hypothetical protein
VSDYAFVAEQTRNALATVAKLERALARDPESASIQINLASRQKFARQMQEELHRSALFNQVELCNYRLLPERAEKYAIPYISASLLAYQHTFSQIYDSFVNGRKQRAIIGKEAWLDSLLEFGYSYSGSLGVILLVPSERTFFEGRFDASIDTMYQVLEINSQDDVRDIARTRGEAVVKRVFDWLEANVSGGFAVDVKWTRSDGRQLGQVIELGRMEKIVEIISATSDEKLRDFDVAGTLVGLNVQTGSFQIAADDDVGSYRGGLDEGFFREVSHNVPGQYKASLTEILTVNYATNREERKYRLKSLSRPTSA